MREGGGRRLTRTSPSWRPPQNPTYNCRPTARAPSTRRTATASFPTATAALGQWGGGALPAGWGLAGRPRPHWPCRPSPPGGCWRRAAEAVPLPPPPASAPLLLRGPVTGRSPRGLRRTRTGADISPPRPKPGDAQAALLLAGGRRWAG